MEYRHLGNSELRVSSLCLGTMTFGEQNPEVDAFAQLDLAFASGVNFVDTAEMYPVPPRAETYGTTETIVGNWLKGRARDSVILATKVSGPARALKWIRKGPHALDAVNIREAVEGSLRRLQTDYIDLYQLHWPERNTPMFGQYTYDAGKNRACTPILDQLQVLGDLVKEGKVRHIGLSNETPYGVCEFVRLAETHGLPRVVSVQNAYSLLNRSFEQGMSEACHYLRVPLMGYSPLGFGFLTGKYMDDPAAVGRVTLFDGFAQRYAKENVLPATRAYVELARAHGLTPATMALAFANTRWFMGSTIIGATSTAQLREDIAAFEVTLSAEVLDAIDAIHLRYTNPAP